MKRMKGQSATEYLMTYGWAILAIAIVGALIYTQVLNNPSNDAELTYNAAKSIADESECRGLAYSDYDYIAETGSHNFYSEFVMDDCTAVCIVDDATAIASLHWEC